MIPDTPAGLLFRDTAGHHTERKFNAAAILGTGQPFSPTLNPVILFPLASLSSQHSERALLPVFGAPPEKHCSSSYPFFSLG